jgi:hypothetical protein
VRQLEITDLDDEDFAELLRDEALSVDLNERRSMLLLEAADRIAALAGDLFEEGAK